MIRFRLFATSVFVFATALTVGTAGEDRAAGVSPREALGQLRAGNDRFARNASKPVSLSVNRRRELAAGEHPAAMVLSCADSRVPPEHVFNAGLGDLIVIRAAGQVVDRSALATMELAAEQRQVPLLVVMGHDSCDVVRAALEPKAASESANLDYLMQAIRAARRPSDEERADRDETKALVLANVEQVINDTLARSSILRRRVDEGRLDVVGAYYEMVSGRVVFSEPVAPAPAVAPARPAARP